MDVTLSASKEGGGRCSPWIVFGCSTFTAKRAAAQAHSNDGFVARDEVLVEKSKMSREKGLQGDAVGWIGDEGIASQTASRSECEACRVSFVGVRGACVESSARDAILSSVRKPFEGLARKAFGSEAEEPNGLVG